jgi:serine/threonine protein kinase
MNWKKGQKIGTGGFGDVYLGLNNDNGELFALKELEVDTSTDDKTKKVIDLFSCY